MDAALLRFYGATFSYAVTMGLGYPMVSEFLELEFGATDFFIGIVLGVYGFMQIFLRLPMGDMADRKGRRRSLLLAFGFTFVSGLFFTFAQSAWWIVPAVAAFGFAGGVFWVAANSYLYDRVALLEERAAGSGPATDGEGGGGAGAATDAAGRNTVERATSDYSLAVALSFLVGPIVGHWIADAYGFRAAYALFLVASLAGAGLVLSLPEAPRAERAKPTTSPYRRAVGLMRDRPVLVLSAIGTLLYATLFSTMNAFFQLHALAVGVALGMVGFLLSGRQLAAIVIRVPLPRVLARFGPLRVLYAGVATAAVATLLTPQARDFWSLAAIVSLFGFAIGLMIPANLMLVNKGAPPDERGLANGIYGTMLGLGSALAPWAFGALGDAFGRQWAFRGAGALALVGIALLLVIDKRFTDAHEPVVDVGSAS